MNNSTVKSFNWTPVFLGFGVLVVIGVVIALVMNFTKGEPTTTPSGTPEQGSSKAPAPAPSSPPYTNTQSALTDRFWCNGPCIT
jgi:hypothetical protein